MGYQKRSRWGLQSSEADDTVMVYAEIYPHFTDMDGNPIKKTSWGWKTLPPLPFRSSGNRTKAGAMKEAEEAVKELWPSAYV